MYTIRKLFKFEGAHILTSSFDKDCQRIHGHSYKVEVFISSKTLNHDGMVVDFKLLSRYIGDIIDEWDHVLLYESGKFPENIPRFPGMEAIPFNPTAENMCNYLYSEIKQKVPNGYKLKVRIHETDTGYAEYTEGE